MNILQVGFKVKNKRVIILFIPSSSNKVKKKLCGNYSVQIINNHISLTNQFHSKYK